MEFKEAYKTGLKKGKTITNGAYELRLVKSSNPSKEEIEAINKLTSFLANSKDNWKIIETKRFYERTRS